MFFFLGKKKNRKKKLESRKKKKSSFCKNMMMMNKLYDAVIDLDTRFQIMSQTFDEHIFIHNWPNMLNVDTSEVDTQKPPKKTSEFFFQNQKALHFYAYQNYGTSLLELSLSEGKEILWPPLPNVINDFTQLEKIFQRSQNCVKNRKFKPNVFGLYIYHNDHDFGANQQFFQDIVKNPHTPCKPFPIKEEIKLLATCKLIVVQTSFGFWVITRRDVKEAKFDFESYDSVYDTLDHLLTLKSLQQETHGPRNNTELANLNQYLQIANSRMFEANIRIKYYHRSDKKQDIEIY